ncbi:tetratricopeptide repeat protein [Hydrogenivirga sp. 128-5-R1-1]|uniref:tetratricopeptide repeat protein n=1 Tax=Hydrogenivirga sp. 128-5-R1-1 TaxID=392423 RepID=UPI00015F2E95|nr:tetratricopeptide repeat protein [Hydrogenivirga sp. 128-5-R1-1]EDP73655.1 hypothetical protein HG1285_05440 [Hydrogenivirga sp. 128-5-R1-1]
MRKEKPPIEENVDLELEYKLLHLYDKIKPYLKQITAGFVILILAVLFFLYHQNKVEEKKNKASILAYEINKDIQNKKYDEALKKIKFFKANFADTDYIKLVYGYELIIEKNKNIVNKETIKKLKENLSTDQTKNYIAEFEGYLNYKNKKYDNALSKLNQINQSNFNYLSALTLKGFIYEKKGDTQKAKEIFDEIKELSKEKYRYFEALAKENI